MAKVLFVCTGNICRSPMAEALLRVRFDRDEARRDWRTSSAGTVVTGGHPASAHAVEEMAQRGIDLRAHRSRSVSRALMAEADLVLAMAYHHVEALETDFPEHVHKVHLLSEMVGLARDVSDPYGGTRREYASIAQELEQLIEDGYDLIAALAGGAAGG